MVACGHQLGCGDHSSWLMSSSALAPVGGSTSTTQILHRIMADELYEDPSYRVNSALSSTQTEFLQSKRINLAKAKEREGKFLKHRESRIALRRSKVDSYHDFSDFEDSEHFDGCPMKWLFRRQSTESWRSGASKDGQDKKRNTRDKVPKEIQIRKIGLRKRLRSNKKKQAKDEPSEIEDPNEVFVEKWREVLNREERRAILEAKLNFRPFDDNEDFENNDDDSHKLQNVLFPRPLTGQRPWLCVLLAPRFDENYSKSRPKKSVQQSFEHLREQSVDSHSPIVSFRSITFPEIEKVRPSTTQVHVSRRIRKKKTAPSRQHMAYRTPALLDITLREGKKPHDMTAVEEEKIPEEVEKDLEFKALMEEDKFYRLRKFLGIEEKDDCQISKIVVNDGGKSIAAKGFGKKGKQGKTKAVKESMLLISNRVQFFERPGKPMR